MWQPMRQKENEKVAFLPCYMVFLFPYHFLSSLGLYFVNSAIRFLFCFLPKRDVKISFVYMHSRSLSVPSTVVLTVTISVSNRQPSHLPLNYLSNLHEYSVLSYYFPSFRTPLRKVGFCLPF